MPAPHLRPSADVGLLLSQHKLFLEQAQSFVSKDISDGKKPYKDFLDTVFGLLQSHERWLTARLGDETARGDCPVQWGTVEVARDTKEADDKSITLRIYGPRKEDTSVISVADEATAETVESEIRTYDKMSKALVRAASQASTIFASKQAARHRDNQEVGVEGHIALLKQYNDVRDIGQQLIGIIAENRGVPVRSLYTDGSFGMGQDD